MKNISRIFSFMAAFFLILGTSCTKVEDAPWKSVEFKVTSNLVDNKGEIPTEGGTVTFTVETNGNWTYAVSEPEASWLTATVEENTLALLFDANNTDKNRNLSVSIVSSTDPTYSESFTIVQIPSVAPKATKADLLDVVFHADGTAEDVSPLKNQVIYYPGDNATWYYNDTYKRIVPTFFHTPGKNSLSTGYYRVDYYENETFKTALENGHSLEFVMRMNKLDGNNEHKLFAAHQGGGTGFLMSTDDRNGKPANITFLPNVPAEDGGSSTWIWCHSDVEPEIGRYYHVIGIWDKLNGEARIYVDGELKGVTAAKGYLRHASDGSRWFAIGCDSANGNGGNGGNGDVVLARAYSSILTDDDIKLLYEDVKNVAQTPQEFDIANVSFLGDTEVAAGYKYTIYGTGFQSGDAIRFTSTEDYTVTMDIPATVTQGASTQAVSVDVPSIPAGRYNFFMTVVRNGCQYPLGLVHFTMVSNPSETLGPKVIAHRGHHSDGSTATENSVAALQSAQALGVYGVEFDVWATSDGKVVINHNATVTGSDLKIEDSTYDQLKDLTLANGEKLPTFEQYLEEAKKFPKVRLICELKSHSTAEKNQKAVEAIVAAVKAAGLDSQVDYIAFDYQNCKDFAAAFPNASVQYLSSSADAPAPSKLAADKITGLDYSYTVLAANPSWVQEAHDLGLTANVWTVNSTAQITSSIKMGVDFITTDNPKTLMETLKANPFISK